MKNRQEKDSLGIIEIPQSALYGAFTKRAKENFKISGQTMPHIFWSSLAIIKKAAAKTHMELKLIESKKASAIIKACDEIISGKWLDEMVVDKFQAGAGTPWNMNINEVLANRANQILGGKIGKYDHIHPNNEVNMSQSTNDVIPTAGRIAALKLKKELSKNLATLISSFKKIAKKAGKQMKVGRTHLEDAVPMLCAQEFEAFAKMLEKSRKRIDLNFQELNELGIGGSAIGSGINTHPKYQTHIIRHLSKFTGIKFKASENLFEIAQSMDAFVQAMSSLKILAIDLIKISNDLRILNMGPDSGIHEISLKEVQAGSSIMPGKVNPSIEECVLQVATQILGMDHSVSFAAQAGQLQLNIMAPIITVNLIESLQLLINTLEMWREKSIIHIEFNFIKIQKLLNKSLANATALNPYFGYEITAHLIKQSRKEKTEFIKFIKQLAIIEENDLKTILSEKFTAKPSIPDKNIIKRINKNQNFQKLKKTINN
jgi:aspartate ammonia-lyase